MGAPLSRHSSTLKDQTLLQRQNNTEIPPTTQNRKNPPKREGLHIPPAAARSSEQTLHATKCLFQSGGRLAVVKKVERTMFQRHTKPSLLWPHGKAKATGGRRVLAIFWRAATAAAVEWKLSFSRLRSGFLKISALLDVGGFEGRFPEFWVCWLPSLPRHGQGSVIKGWSARNLEVEPALQTSSITKG